MQITQQNQIWKFYEMYLCFQSFTMDLERQPLLKNKQGSRISRSIQGNEDRNSKFMSI